MRKLLLLLSLFVSVAASAQKITGIIFNSNGDLLPYASVTIKGTTIGASANNRAKFSISVTAGNYVLVVQHIGYTTQELKVAVTDQDQDLTVILKEQKLTMKEVVVKSNGEDPAYAIIREAIKKRPFYAEQVKGFTCDLYTKDLIKLRKLPKRIFGQKIEQDDRNDMGLDTTGAGIIYLSESIAKVGIQQPDQFKMQVISSRVSGSGGFGFSFPTFISMYQNNVVLFTERLNPRGFVSPIADGALGFYKFKFLGSYFEDGKEINSIRVTPRRNYEPLFSGIINITEGDWRIHSLDLVLTKQSQLEIIDTLQITQIHVPVTKDEWRVKNQLLHFSFNQFGIDAVGNFVNVYSNYTLNPVFDKKYFDRVIIKYDTGVNKKPRSYWDSTRPVPLEKEEAKDYQVKDSLYLIRKDSVKTQFTIDSLKKRQGPVKPLKVFFSGINRTYYSKTNTYQWGIESLLPHAEYNTAEGVVVNLPVYVTKYLRKQKANLTVKPTLRYGFSNRHFNAWTDMILKASDRGPDQRSKRYTLLLSGGKRVSQFNKNAPISPAVNTFSTLLYGDNYLKTYENYFLGLGYENRFESGVQFSVKGLYENRLPLDNTTDYTFAKSKRNRITPNYPYEVTNGQFTRHEAVILQAQISINPGQRYIQFPYSKIPIGSKYPTFTLQYSKGVKGILGSDVDFDKWKFTVNDDVNLHLLGMIRYKIGAGGFLNRNSVFIQDYHHFNGNLSVLAGEYLNSFQLEPYYALSNTAKVYGLLHTEHHFNGLLTNKIPYFNRLNWNLVAATNVLYIDKNNNHIELSIGLENIAKILRIELVAGFENGGRRRNTGIVIGFGGLLGSSVNNSLLTANNGNGF